MLRNERSSFRQTVDLPVQVDVRGIRLPMNATIVDISVSGCRLRSWVALERGVTVAFDWPRPALKLRLAGSIVARRPCAEGGAFEYGLTFTGLLPSESDALQREILEAQRREAFNRAQREADMHTAQAGTSNRRTAYRANVEFPLEVTYVDRPEKPIPVTASDISAGGLRISSQREFAANDEIVVRFRLPGHVLRVYPEKIEDEIVMTPFGPRRRSRNQRRPFEEMRIRSRIASRLADVDGMPAYGVAFVEVEAYTREEIARFIHAVQLGELRARSSERR